MSLISKTTYNLVFRRFVRIVRTSFNAAFPNNGTFASTYDEYTGNTDVLWIKVRTWYRTPGFLTLRKTKALLPDNAYEFILTTLPLIQPTASVQQDYTDGSYVHWNLSFKGTWASPYREKASIGTFNLNAKLLDKMRRSQWNASIFIGELRKTESMVVDRARHLAHLFLALKSGNIRVFLSNLRFAVGATETERAVKTFNKRFGRDSSKAVANAVLEFKYGWMPFVKDVRDAMETLMDMQDMPEPNVFTVKASYVQNGTIIENEQGILYYNNGLVDIRARVNVAWSEQQRATWRFRINALDIPARLGLTNPAEVLWELVPLSFVVDWFLPIGKYFAAYDTSLRVSHVGGSTGTRIYTHCTLSSIRHQSTKTVVSGLVGGGQWLKINRAPMNGVPVLRLSEMPLNLGLNAGQFVSAIALLRQSTSGIDLRRLRG